jgi:hypothetical protein
MVLSLSGVPPDPCHKSGNTTSRPGGILGSRCASLRTQALSQSAQTEAIALLRPSEQDCQRSKTSKTIEFYRTLPKTGPNPVPKGRLKRCFTVTYVTLVHGVFWAFSRERTSPSARESRTGPYRPAIPRRLHAPGKGLPGLQNNQNDRILSNFTQNQANPVPKGRLKIAQDEILGTLQSRREVPKGRLKRCFTVKYVAWSTGCLRRLRAAFSRERTSTECP